MITRYDIWNKEDLEGLRYLGKDLKMLKILFFNDIDFGNESWTPIDLSDCNYPIIINGNNKKISNLKITSNDDNIGLFGLIGGSLYIRDLNLTDCSISGQNNVGTFVGECLKEVMITNCIIDNSKIVGKINVGVMVGSTDIINCKTVAIHCPVEGVENVGSVAGYCREAIIRDTFVNRFVRIAGYNYASLNGFVGAFNKIDIDRLSSNIGFMVTNKEILDGKGETLVYVPKHDRKIK